jgi:translation initiation factor 2 subunit 3
MYFYSELEPKVNDYVIIKVREIKEFGYICELPEFDNKIAYLNINDITTEKIKKMQDLKKYLKPNTIDVLEVKEIDQVGNINLNRKYLDEQLIKNVHDKYILYEKIYNYSINNSKVIEEEKNKIISELKNYKVEDLNIQNFLDKFPILSNLKINTEVHLDLTDSYYFEYMDYININELKDKICQIKEKYNDILDIFIINLKIGKFNIKTKKKYNLEFFENLKDEIIKITPRVIKEEYIVIEDNQDFEQPILNIGIIGHVSHGKTTLIQRLTNIDTKKYKKELETNKTLKLGYTNAHVTKCCCTDNVIYINKKCNNINNTCISKLISIVDCPGHHVLMNTMLCGTSIMDTSIIMIAANELCPQPQTIDHIMAITINENSSNHFDNSLVILNKCDLIQKTEAETRYKEIKEFINGSLVENCNILPTSAQKNINLNNVTEWMFNYVTSKDNTVIEKEQLKALIVRTFDINKPGTSIDNISGLVIGCSIINGELNIGDEIIILPECIRTNVYELYTDKIPLKMARKGGLIGVKTNLNPKYAELLTGSFFIKSSDFNSEYLQDENSEINLKYFIRKDNSSFKKIFKEGEFIDVNIQGKFIKNCKIQNKKDKYVKLKIPYKIYIQDESIKISFLKNNTLIGYGEMISDNKQVLKNKLNLNIDINFQQKLSDLYKELEFQEINNRKNLIKLPNPIVSYSNTVSIFQNFIEISNMISANHINLGNYIMNELGLKNMSINEDQLILKGKTNENRIENILTKYLLEYKLCQNCLSYETFYNKVQNCRLLVCSKCNYTVKK